MSTPSASDLLAREANQLNIAMCADSRFFEGLETCFISIIAFSHRHTSQFNFYCIDDGNVPHHRNNLEKLISQAEKKFNTEVNLHWIEFDPDSVDGLDELKGSCTYYVRLLLANLIPNEDWVVWVDSDMFCMKDMSSISGYLDETTPVFGVIDPIVPTLAKDMGDIQRLNTMGYATDLPYINSGFLLINLAIWRKDQLSEKLIPWAREHDGNSSFHDQSVINWNLADRMGLLPNEYNTVDKSLLADESVIAVDELPAFINYHATGKNKLWMLNFQTTVKNAALDYCRIVMVHTYLKFRKDHMDLIDADRFSSLKQTIQAHPYLQQSPSPLFIYNAKILLYTLTGNRRLQRHWKQSKAHYIKHASTMCRVMRRIAQEIETPSSLHSPD